MNSTIQLRIDEKTKAEAGEVFEKLGIDLSAGIKLYLKQVIRSKSIPFIATTENGFTPVQESKILKELAHARKNGKAYSSIGKLHKEITNA